MRTPIARHTSVISDHMSWFHGATAPPSMVRDSSGTSVAGSTVRTVPVPPQARQAPWLLNASSSAEGAEKVYPQTGLRSGCPAATAIDGGR